MHGAEKRSLPSRGAWIEMLGFFESSNQSAKSLPSRGAWIEIAKVLDGNYDPKESLPSRGAWIEIYSRELDFLKQEVAPLAGSVD